MEQKMMMEMEHTPCPGTGVDTVLVPEQVLALVRCALAEVRMITTLTRSIPGTPYMRGTAQRALDALARVEAVLVEAMAWEVRVTTVDLSGLHAGCKACGAGPDEGCECSEETKDARKREARELQDDAEQRRLAIERVLKGGAA